MRTRRQTSATHSHSTLNTAVVRLELGAVGIHSRWILDHSHTQQVVRRLRYCSFVRDEGNVAASVAGMGNAAVDVSDDALEAAVDAAGDVAAQVRPVQREGRAAQ